MDRSIAVPRQPSLGEEIANSVSHGVVALAGLVAAPFLIVRAAHRGGALSAAGMTVFVVTLVLLYLASTIYHALPPNAAKRVFRVLDHSAIYLLIAGTYTPFTLGILRGPLGWTLFGVVWALAACGTVMKAVGGIRFPRISTVLYIAMGWLAVAAIPLWPRIPVSGWLWLIAGGVAYTAGVAFYATDHRVRYGHFIWHVFVVAGTACHAVAVLRYAT